MLTFALLLMEVVIMEDHSTFPSRLALPSDRAASALFRSLAHSLNLTNSQDTLEYRLAWMLVGNYV